MRRAVLRLSAAVAVVALAACGEPTRDRAATEAVFLETCAPGETPLEERVCRCAFERIVEELSAAEFERLDRNLRDDPETVPAAVTEAALACAAEPLTPPTPRPTTSTTADPTDPAEDETTTTAEEQPGG